MNLTAGPRRRDCLWSRQVILILSIINSMLAFSIGNPVSSRSSQLTHHIQAGRNIRHLPCKIRRSGEEGVCMFAIDCLKSNGTHLGTCIDRFYFGSCCQLQAEENLYVDHEISDNSIDGPDNNHVDNVIPSILSHIKPSVTNSSSSKVETTAQPQTTTVKPVTRTTMKLAVTSSNKKPTTSRPLLADSTISSTSSSHRPPTTTTTEAIASTTIQNPPESGLETTVEPNGEIPDHNKHSNSNSTNFEMISLSTGVLESNKTGSGTATTAILATLSTKLPVFVGEANDDAATASRIPSNEQPLIVEKIPPPIPTTTTTTVTETVDNVEFTTFQSVDQNPSAAAPTSMTTTRKPPPRKPVTKKPTKVPVPQTTTTPASAKVPPPRRTTVTPIIQDAILPHREPPILYNQVKTTTSTTSRPRITTRKPSPTYSEDNLIQISISPPKKPATTTPKPVTTTVATRKPQIKTTTKRPFVTTTQKIITTTGSRKKPKPTKPVKISPTLANEPFTTMSYVETTKAPRPKPKPTSAVEIVPATNLDHLIGDPNEDVTTIVPVKEEQRTTTAKPVVESSSVKVETATSTTFKQPTTTTSAMTTETTTTKTIGTTHVIVSSTASSVTSAPTVGLATTAGSEEPSPLADEVNKEETTVSEGLVTWTNIELIEQNFKPNATEAPQSSQWVPLETISTDVVKNGSTTTFVSTTSQISVENVTESNINIPVILPVNSTEEFNSDNEEEEVELTTILPPVDEPSPVGSDNTTSTTTKAPSIFPSLEGVDYRQICGKRMFPEPRIVGGAMASFGRWPWQISLRQWRTSTYLHKCGAALLNENWAITAAHCVDNVPPSDLLLRLGEFDLAEEDEPYGYQERRVQIVASHPQFDPRTFEYDLALLRFYEPVVFQPNIIPVCVPDTDENFIGRTAYVTGWGRLYEDGPLPSKLQEVSVPVIENKICESMYRNAGYIEHIPHIFICAGWKKGGYDSCEGDSGGPMVIQRNDKRFQLAGVISWGIGCAEPDQPGVYTRISEFRDWINQILQF